MSIKTEAELAGAINRHEDTIEIEGDLANMVFKIKATGDKAWIVAIATIGAAVIIVISTGGLGAPVAAFSAVGAVTILGVSATTSAIAIAAAAGGVGVLNSLRSYEIIENDGNRLVLKKR
jgi:hypothetical protein